MVRSRVFVFAAVILCFVACLCAQANVSEEDAINAFNDAEKSTMKAVKMAERELKEAENVKRDLEWYEDKAEKRVSEAAAVVEKAIAAANAAFTAAKQNRDDPTVTAARKIKSDAEAEATRIKHKLQNARTAYPDAKTDTDKAIQSLKDVLLKARKLNQEAEIKIFSGIGSPIDFNKVKENALDIKTQAAALETKIENSKTLLSGAKAIIHKMPAPTNEELVVKYKADGLASFVVLDNIVGEADGIVLNIDYEKSDVSMSVEIIKKILKRTRGTLYQRINVFLTTAQGDLETLSQRVNEVHTAQQNIIQWKQYAEKSKENLKKATNQTDALREIRFFKYYAYSAASNLEKMKETLKSTGQYVRSAHNQKRSATKELIENEGALNSEVITETEKPKTIVEDTKLIPTREVTEQKTNQKKEESKEETTEILTNQEAKQQTDQHKEKQVEETTVKPTKKDAVQLTDLKQQEPAEKETTTPTSKTTEVPTKNKTDQLTEEQTTKSINKAAEVHTENKPRQSAEEAKTKLTTEDADGHTKSQPEQSAEETTTLTSKTQKVPTDNKPDQLTEEQIPKPTSNVAERQTANKPKQSAQHDTELPQKDATVKPTLINPEKEIIEPSQSSANQASGKHEKEKTVHTKNKKAEIPNLDKLRKGTKNITSVPFIGENIQTSGAWSDGSMIVSVPLLAALIASAVLH